MTLEATQPAASPAPSNRAGRFYLNAVLTANVALLALIAINGLSPSRPGPGDAYAQSVGPANPDGDDGSGRISAAEQRKVIITEIRAVGSRVERIERVLSKGLSVRVTEMPPGFARNGNDSKDSPKPGDPKK